MKLFIVRTLLCFCLFTSLAFGARVNVTYTVAAGTPVRVADGATSGTISVQPLIVNRLLIQMKHAGTGLGIVMDGIPVGTTADSTKSAHVTAELAPATATAPGGSYSDTRDPASGSGIDLSRMWIDGSHTGDTIIVSYDTRN